MFPLLLLGLGSVNAAESGRTIAENVQVRAGATLDSSVLTTLKRGALLSIIGRDGGWHRIGMPTGETGWVNSRYVLNLGGGELEDVLGSQGYKSLEFQFKSKYFVPSGRGTLYRAVLYRGSLGICFEVRTEHYTGDIRTWRAAIPREATEAAINSIAQIVHDSTGGLFDIREVADQISGSYRASGPTNRSSGQFELVIAPVAGLSIVKLSFIPAT